MTPVFDIAVFGVLLMSAALGFFSGATREMVRALSLLLAAALAIYGLRWTGPVGRDLIDPDWAGTVTAGLAVFVLTYATLRIVGGAMVSGVRGAHMLGALDRTVGLGFGLLRGALVLAALMLAFQAATPPERVPRWITGATSYPYVQAAARTLKAFAPKGIDMAGRLTPSIGEAVRDGSVTRRGDSGDAEGYDPRERRSLDDLVEQSR